MNSPPTPLPGIGSRLHSPRSHSLSDLGVIGGDAVHLPHQATGPLEVVRPPFVHAATSQCAHMITVYEWSTNRRRLMSAASAGPPLSLTQLAADRSVWALG